MYVELSMWQFMEILADFHSNSPQRKTEIHIERDNHCPLAASLAFVLDLVFCVGNVLFLPFSLWRCVNVFVCHEISSRYISHLFFLFFAIIRNGTMLHEQ